MRVESWQEYVQQHPICQEICSRDSLRQHAKFERACAVALCQAIVDACNQSEPHAYGLENRTPASNAPATLAITYRGKECATCRIDQSPLHAGEADRGLKAFWGSHGRMRPDVTLLLNPPGAPTTSAFVCECRARPSRQDALDGYYRAALYRKEYDGVLRCLPRAALITAGEVPGTDEARQLETVACTWKAWPMPHLVAACCQEMRRSLEATVKGRKYA